jgi:hypothetical protein
LELALRVDNVETVVPEQYPDSPQAHRLSAQAGPGPTCGKRTTRNGGLELAKRTLTHECCSLKEDLGAEGAPLGAYESTKEQRTSSTRTGNLLKLPGSQSDAAAARHNGAGGGRRDHHPSADASGRSPGARPMHGTSTRMGAGPRRRVPNPAPQVVGEVPLLGPTLYDSDPTPKANRLGEETTTRQPTLPDAALGLDRCMELRLGWV